MAYINLHKGYKVPGYASRKFSTQRMGPFRVIKAHGHQAYELDLLKELRIHPVISIANLTPAPLGKDPFNREQEPSHPPAVNEEGDCVVERIEARRRRRGRGTWCEYLCHFQGYSDKPGA